MSQDQPRLSLLSLSIAASNAAPLAPASPVLESVPRSFQGATTNTTTKHRRISSAGRSRRRLSDARDAATRPFPTSLQLQTASASLAALSLSSPTVSHRRVNSAQPIQVSRATSARETSKLEPGSDDTLSISPPQSHTPLASNPINGTKSGRKRGTIFTCESCSKVYRHPSCLIKHRWEHTPQWREASKFVLSKHQQVQLLEAAAILSHLSPSSASLPEDRSLWPSFLSGGLVPPPSSVPAQGNGDVGHAPTSSATETATASASPPPSMGTSISAYGVHASHPISCSVPASTTMGSSPGTRLHGFSENGIGTAQVRPGMLGMPTGTDGKSTSVGVGVPATQTTETDALNLLALHSGMSGSVPLSHSHSHSHTRSHSYGLRERTRRRSNAFEYGIVPRLNAGWTLPRSSVRSKSRSSRSASESRSDDEHEHEHDDDDDEGGVDVRVGLEDEMEDGVDRATVYGSRMREDVGDVEGGKGVRGVEQTWDGMEMEMEMD